MTKEEIIATAIREAFRCGKEAGEESQRMYAKMQQEIDRVAEQGKPGHDQHQYDGIFGMIPNPKVTIDPESALNPDSDHVTFQIETMRGRRIGDTPEEQVAMLDHQCCLLKQENVSIRAKLDEKYAEIGTLENENEKLGKILEEKDATITELRAQLQLYTEKDTVPVGSPTGESTHASTTFHEGDQVVISTAFFDENEEPDLHGTILKVLDDSCVVLITEEDSIYDDVDFVIRHEYITKA